MVGRGEVRCGFVERGGGEGGRLAIGGVEEGEGERQG